MTGERGRRSDKRVCSSQEALIDDAREFGFTHFQQQRRQNKSMADLLLLENDFSDLSA